MSECSHTLPARACAALADIATVRPGLAFRTRLEYDPAGTLRVVQAKDVGDDGTVDCGAATLIAERRVKSDYLLRIGDVIFQPKGMAIRAGLVGEDVTNTVAAAPLLIIRPAHDRVLPAFLVVVLNMPATIAALLQHARGSHIPQVPSDVVKDIHLPLPNLDRQAIIVALAKSMEAEKRIHDEVAALRSRLLEAVTMESARNTQGSTKASG